MMNIQVNKKKIINDPVFGFINIKSDLIFDLIEHEYFQRLRRIKQLGLSCLVYPGANHTRFEHTLGALHLLRLAIDVLLSKGVEITDQEAESTAVAILLHDIGHGPFSHALESTLVSGITHEQLSLLLMERLNIEYDQRLGMSIAIFKNEYHKKFLHQLIASQLDVDRLDYLRRDSFYSGVVEGAIGSDRIIKMLNVSNDQLVIDKKGIYSVEKFLIARRLMYWQVYLHKTVIAAEYILIHVLKRAKELVMKGDDLFAPPQLKWFLQNSIKSEDLKNDDKKSTIIENFIQLDDSDILASVKIWCNHPDKVLSYLSKAIINRKIVKIKIDDKPHSVKKIFKIRETAMSQYALNEDEANYLVFTGTISNSVYETSSEKILVLLKNNKTLDINKASDIDLAAISKTVKKHFLCYPKELEIK